MAKKLNFLPPDMEYLLRTGHLMGAEAIENGWRPLLCIECEEHNLDLIWRHTPLTEQEFVKGQFRECECGKIHGKIAAGTVWGEDVTPICACCSFAHCTHKPQAVSA